MGAPPVCRWQAFATLLALTLAGVLFVKAIAIGLAALGMASVMAGGGPVMAAMSGTSAW